MEKSNTLKSKSDNQLALFQNKRQSKTLPYPASNMEIIKIVMPNENNLSNECDFDEPDLAIGNTSILKANLGTCASKNKNFSSNGLFSNPNINHEESNENKKCNEEWKNTNEDKSENKQKAKNSSEESDDHYYKEIQKDYETFLSKDMDLEETLNHLEVISICSMDDAGDFEESPNINSKVPNSFTFENALEKKKEKEVSEKDSPEKDNSEKMASSTIGVPVSPSKTQSPRSKKKSAANSLIQNHPFRSLIFSPYISEPVFMKHLLQTYKGLVYAKKCLKVQISEYQRDKSVNLKEKRGNRYKTLFLDLDETLIHACSISENPQHIIKGTGAYGSEILIGFNVRPYCIEFLKKLSQFYEIVIFTASMSNYAHAIVDFLDPFHQYVSEVLTRSSCIRTKSGFFIKDLRIIKNRELKNMMIVDNLSHSFGLQIDNGIPILEFLNDKKDRELKHLYDHLLEGLYVDDVRVFNRKKLQLNLLSEMRIEELRIY